MIGYCNKILTIWNIFRLVIKDSVILSVIVILLYYVYFIKIFLFYKINEGFKWIRVLIFFYDIY